MAAAGVDLSEAYTNLARFIEEEEFEDALECCDEVIERGNPEAEGRQDDLRTRVLCMVHLSQYEEALEEMSAKNMEAAMAFERAYCLYSLSRYDETLTALKKIGKETPGTLHLEAQVHYRRGDYEEAAGVYEKLLKLPGYEGVSESDFVTNVLAAYASAQQTERGTALCEELSPASWEGVYNMACIQMDAGLYEEARRALAAAQKKGRETLELEDVPEDEIEDELAVVQTQLAYLEQLSGNGEEAMEAYNNVLKAKPEDMVVDAVARNNIVSLKGERDLFLGLKHLKIAHNPALKRRLSTRQRVTVERNHALLLLLMGKSAECQRQVEAIRTSNPTDDHGAVLAAALQYRQKKYTQCCATLQDFIQTNKADAQVCLVAQLTLAEVYMSRDNAAEAAKALQSIPVLQHRPAMVATLVGMFDGLGDDAAAVGVLDSAVAYWKNQNEGSTPVMLSLFLRESAAFKSKRGMMEEAAAVYKRLLKLQPDDHAVVASAIVAAAQCDPASAKKYETMLPELSSAAGLDAEELEAMDPPRSKRFRDGGNVKSMGEVDEEERAKIMEAIKAKRKKKRTIKYPKNYDPANPGKVDPERWLPRRERTKGRKGRKKGGKKFTGGQGGESAKDAKLLAKLDQSSKVEQAKAAEQAAEKAAGTPEKAPKAEEGSPAASGGGGGGGGGGSQKKSQKKNKSKGKKGKKKKK